MIMKEGRKEGEREREEGNDRVLSVGLLLH